MENLNTVTLTGNLTKDPELRTTPGGTSLCKLRLAVNGRRKDASGEWVDKPNFFDVTVWGRQGENCATYLQKGRGVALVGRLDWHEWEATDGGKRQAVEVVAERVQFLSDGQGRQAPAESDVPADTDGLPQSHNPSTVDPQSFRPHPQPASSAHRSDDDIPF